MVKLISKKMEKFSVYVEKKFGKIDSRLPQLIYVCIFCILEGLTMVDRESMNAPLVVGLSLLAEVKTGHGNLITLFSSCFFHTSVLFV